MKNAAKSEKFFIYSLLCLGAWLLVSQLLGTGIHPGDDAYFAVDRFRRDGIFDSSFAQSVGQGRFYYVLTMSMTQLLYLDDSMILQNIFKMLSDYLLFIYFFRFVKELFGFQTAAITSFIGFALFNTYGAAVNPFFAWPMMYGLGAAVQLFSFLLYTKATKNKTSNIAAYVFFFLSLCFYEPMLFYSLAYLAIYFYFNSHQISTFGLVSWLKQAFKKNIGLFVSVFTYLLIYIIFRQVYPSNYEGSKELTLSSVGSVLKTIYYFSINGIQTNVFFNYEDLSRTSLATAAIVVGLILSFIQIKSEKIKSLSLWQNLNVILVLIFFVFCPNFLYGFVEKYRVWVTYSPYYVSSFYSAFALILLCGYVTNLCWNYISRYNKFLKLTFVLFLSICFGVLGFSNISQASLIHLEFRLHGLRWPLLKSSLNDMLDSSIQINTICTNSFMLSPEDTYNYWPLYLSNYYDKKITMRAFKPDTTADCDLFLDYFFSIKERKISIKILPKNSLKVYSNSLDL